MKYIILAGFAFLISITSFKSFAELPDQHTEYLAMCADLQYLYNQGKFAELSVIPEDAYKQNKNFFADIDNDGKEEEFKYFHTRTYALFMEVVGDKIRGLPSMADGNATVFYSGSDIIRYKEKNLHVHYAKGLFEVQELTEKTPDDNAYNPLHPHAHYNVKLLCKYYE